MKILLGIGALVLAALGVVAFGHSGAPAPAARGGEAVAQPVLVELFTSQGCSSCPPADRLLEKLDGEGGVVAVSRPVTYWDRLGWKDTLARDGNDRLQRRYAARAIPGSGVYTPEAVVQGATATVGSDERQLRHLVDAARDRQAIGVSQAGNRVTATRARADVELRFMALARKSLVDVAKGENRRRKLGYTNVLINETIIPCDPTVPCSAPIPASIAGQRGADRWAVVLQDRDGGTVRAVRWIRPPA